MTSWSLYNYNDYYNRYTPTPTSSVGPTPTGTEGPTVTTERGNLDPAPPSTPTGPITDETPPPTPTPSAPTPTQTPVMHRGVDYSNPGAAPAPTTTGSVTPTETSAAPPTGYNDPDDPGFRIRSHYGNVEYRVEPNDNLWKIASRQLGSSATNTDIANYVKQIVQLNNLSNGGNLIYPGQTLKLP